MLLLQNIISGRELGQCFQVMSSLEFHLALRFAGDVKGVLILTVFRKIGICC